MSVASVAPTTTASATRPRKILLARGVGGLDALHLARRIAKNGSSTVFVARDAERAAQFAAQFAFFAPSIPVLPFPAWDCLPYDRISPNAGIMATRLATLAGLGEKGSSRLVLTTVNALTQRVPAPDVVRSGRLVVKAGTRIKRDDLVAHLERNGFRRAGTVVEAGEYAVRGGLLDLWPTGQPEPLRLDFFGAVLETIRSFDALTQRSSSKHERIVLQAVSEVTLDPASIDRFKTAYLQRFGAVTGDPLLEAVSAGRHFPGMEHWLPLFHEKLVTLFDHLGSGWTIAFDHHADEAIEARQALVGEHYRARQEPAPKGTSFGTTVYRPLPPELLYLDENALARQLADRPSLTYSPSPPPLTKPQGIDLVVDLGARPVRDFTQERQDRNINLFQAIADHVRDLTREGKDPILATHSEGSADRLRTVLGDHGLPGLPVVTSLAEADAKPGAKLAVLPMERGFYTTDIIILGEVDLLGDRLQRSATRRKRADKFIQDLSVLAEGDHVVHAEHGIGRFEGLITLEIGGAPHDCLKVVYAGGDKLFIPVENLEILSRYGHADQAVQLDKLGGAGWQARKAKVKQRVREVAQELLAIAAQRALRKGQPLETAPGLYDEFVARFPYEETEDQLSAIEAVLTDMASGQPMDRLICGDVGFGKTEVALRAAFVAAAAGRQVAVLAPTTLLARQHYRVFTERFADLPIRVEQLSRFVPAKAQKQVKAELAEGRVDIVVGTHALLAKDVQFKDLGLVVIDEEQHFGVVHKERMKQYRAEVHVLTMTATPIPRTLQMALGGMKDMSVISTPPVDRLAVRSFVMPTDPVVIREALMREHYRGGQSFYVCPRISDQDKLAEDLRKLVPELKIGIANGRMAPKDLEETMGQFYDHRIDVLLATNIVESGLDIPSANTLIVHRADLFGLSQLYQLRGRVGRSKVRGYTYLTTPDKQLADTAERRLNVIQSLEGLGAGFQLASHDLDIRGAGNLLGDEQSGHVKEVGFELYNSMLEEAIAAAKAGAQGGPDEAPTDWTPQITVDAAALMPESWIGDVDLRLAMYRRLASLTELEEIDGFAAELVDRFGKLPPETENLLAIIAVKLLCKRANVAKLDAGPKGIVLSLHQNRFPQPDKLIGLISDSKGKMKVRPDHKIVFVQETKSPGERLKVANRLMDQLARLAA
ncbi:MAG TPA: transcription-repair coupling factor [Geminicoccus sp.]|jgi:transcription-repair coupling factor (superfamily II helicase)|uniref:transcription-repair coupling factor n=1 Tax=Geminicoccus sp. TaxID=2024832 RepID=UPI002E2F8D87|nr:transcription-repair coupling factor [Geminicoccus sp.]HEX2526821.1 transcription-repair coupling factor [Geminicoccus sp.]